MSVACIACRSLASVRVYSGSHPVSGHISSPALPRMARRKRSSMGRFLAENGSIDGMNISDGTCDSCGGLNAARE